MPDVLDDQKSETLDMQRYLDVARRRYPYFLVSFFVGWLIVWAVSWMVPVIYKSGTTILVEQPTMPKDYVVSNINEDVQAQMQNITQQILSRTHLLRIIDQLNLYGPGASSLTPDEKVALMRKSIGIDLVRDPTSMQISAFKVEYSAPNPHIAQRVTRELTNLFISENLEVRQQESEDTTKFLETQLEVARQSLADQDAKIRVFKGQHVGDLPTQQASNLQILSGIQAQLQNEQDALNTARQQQIYLQTLISQYRTLQGTPKTADGVPTGLAEVDKDLERLKGQLTELSAKYTDNYPDVQKVKSQIAKTEKIKEELIANMKDQASGGGAADRHASAHDAAEAVHDPAVVQLQSQLQANKAEITNREQAITGLESKVSEYQARLNDEPIREQQLADLTRGYDQSKANYDELLRKKNESKMATSMEQMQKGQRFRTLDPPSLPLKPDSPNRLKFCGMGVAFGLGLGLMVVAVLEFLDDRLHSEKGIKALLPMKVIVEIPEVTGLFDQRMRVKKMWLGWAMTALVFAAILAGTALSYRHG